MFAREIDIPDYSQGVLKLIKPASVHAPASLHWLSDVEVGQYMGADFSDVSITTENKRIQDILSGDDAYGWMIELDGVVIGAVEINNISECSKEYGVKTGNFSILIGDKQYWGKRIGPHAIDAVMAWGFAFGFELFAAKALASNERSWRALERLGFEYQGIKHDTLAGKPVEWRLYTMADPTLRR